MSDSQKQPISRKAIKTVFLQDSKPGWKAWQLRNNQSAERRLRRSAIYCGSYKCSLAQKQPISRKAIKTRMTGSGHCVCLSSTLRNNQSAERRLRPESPAGLLSLVGRPPQKQPISRKAIKTNGGQSNKIVAPLSQKQPISRKAIKT